MKNKNILRWIAVIIIIAVIAVLEWAKHLYCANPFLIFVCHIVNTAVVAVMVFIAAVFAFRIIDRQTREIRQINAELEKTNKDLDAANKGLEKCVQEKTTDLQKALDDLKKEHEELAKTHEELISTYQNLQKDECELAKIQTYAAKEEKIAQLCAEAGDKLKDTFKNLGNLKNGLTGSDSKITENLNTVSNNILEISKILDQINFWMKTVEQK